MTRLAIRGAAPDDRRVMAIGMPRISASAAAIDDAFVTRCAFAREEPDTLRHRGRAGRQDRDPVETPEPTPYLKGAGDQRAADGESAAEPAREAEEWAGTAAADRRRSPRRRRIGRRRADRRRAVRVRAGGAGNPRPRRSLSPSGETGRGPADRPSAVPGVLNLRPAGCPHVVPVGTARQRRTRVLLGGIGRRACRGSGRTTRGSLELRLARNDGLRGSPPVLH